MMLNMTIDGIENQNSKKKFLISGDSTIAAYACRGQTIASQLFTQNEISQGFSAQNIAVPGHTINQQLAAWNALSNKNFFDVVLVQIGLNDVEQNINTVLTNYQNYINQIRSDIRPDAEIWISCMNPAKKAYLDAGKPQAYANWVTLNNAIMSTISNVDKRNNYHVSLLSDGSDNLADQYNCGDNIHENQAGADIIKEGFRSMIF
ncbi:hypothetical protein DRF62_02045 [Chryseobacterium piscium]|uniref:SGNH hydrolase-type esterase domain-containing protein n=1 Tax=Chryseobacterium piscium TaxID=333702 RepID=A0A3D9BUD4_9FLAO|nr:GDSL-type esterase/lipase family protein [Chryseobacterium piscium]REC56961.1 hypothetical protein DRF62_02045 [Chryseobacterium piscium]